MVQKIIFLGLILISTTSLSCPTCIGYDKNNKQPFFEQYEVSEMPESADHENELNENYDANNVLEEL